MINDGRVVIDPFDAGMIQPCSIDLRLDRSFASFNRDDPAACIDPAAEDQEGLMRTVQADGPDEPIVLLPHAFALATTLETVRLPDDVAGRLEGKSSLGRLGLQTHATAGWIDPGFSGRITLELSNVAPLPIKLWPGMKIGQLCLFRTEAPALRPYGSPGLGSRYQGQVAPTPSRSGRGFHRADLPYA